LTKIGRVLIFITFFVSLSGVVFHVVKGAHKDKNHLLVQSGDIIPHHEDDGSKLTGDRDRVLCVVFLVFVRSSRTYKFPVDDWSVNNGAKLDQKLTIGELSILEVLDFLGLRDPVEEILLGLRANDLEIVESAELPDDGKDKLLVSITDIFGTDTNHLDLEFGSGVECSLAVDTCLEHILGLLLDVFPVDNLVVDPVDDSA